MSGWFSSELALDFQYIDAQLPPESPYLYGLHPNAEIGFLTQTSEKLFRTVLELQPRDSQAGEGAGAVREEKVRGRLALDILGPSTAQGGASPVGLDGMHGADRRAHIFRFREWSSIALLGPRPVR